MLGVFLAHPGLERRSLLEQEATHERGAERRLEVVHEGKEFVEVYSTRA